MQLHVNYCKQFGISEEEIQATEEKQGKEARRLSEIPLAYDGAVHEGIKKKNKRNSKLTLILPSTCSMYSIYPVRVGRWPERRLAGPPNGPGSLPARLRRSGPDAAFPQTHPHQGQYLLAVDPKLRG